MVDYRKKVVIRSIRSFVVAMIVLALPGIVMGLFRTKMLWWTVLAIIPFIMMIKNIIGIITWKLTTATIEWVELVNNLDQPYTATFLFTKEAGRVYGISGRCIYPMRTR